MGDPDISTSVRLPRDLLAKLDRIAKGRKVSRADVIRWFLEDGVKTLSTRSSQIHGLPGAPPGDAALLLLQERLELLEREVRESRVDEKKGVV